MIYITFTGRVLWRQHSNITFFTRIPTSLQHHCAILPILFLSPTNVSCYLAFSSLIFSKYLIGSDHNNIRVVSNDRIMISQYNVLTARLEDLRLIFILFHYLFILTFYCCWCELVTIILTTALGGQCYCVSPTTIMPKTLHASPFFALFPGPLSLPLDSTSCQSPRVFFHWVLYFVPLSLLFSKCSQSNCQFYNREILGFVFF